MRTYICDVCNRDFGHVVVSTLAIPRYHPGDLIVKSGFYQSSTAEQDICNDCYNRIARAQQDTIDKIQGKNMPV